MTRRQLLKVLMALPFAGFIVNASAGMKTRFWRMHRDWPTPTVFTYTLEMKAAMLPEGLTVIHRARCNDCGQFSEAFILPSVEETPETDIWMNGPAEVPEKYKWHAQPEVVAFRKTHRCKS